MEAGHSGELGQHAVSHVEVVPLTDTELAQTQHHHVVERTVWDLMLNLKTATQRIAMNVKLLMFLVHLFVQGHAKISGTKQSASKLMTVTISAGLFASGTLPEK